MRFGLDLTRVHRGSRTQNDRTDQLLPWAAFFGSTALFCQFLSYNFVDIDLWHQMALIRESLRAGHLLTADPYAYTPTLHPWVDHEWGAGAIAYFATAWFGGRAMIVLKFLLALGTGFLCVRCARAQGTDFRILTTCAPLAIFLIYLGFFATVRAQAYSFFFLALMLFLLALDRQANRKWMIFWLLIFPLWVNIHAGFVVSLGLTLVYAFEQWVRGRPARHLLFLAAGMALEIFLNPYGAQYFTYLRRALFMPRPYAPEWGPLWGLGWAWSICFLVAIGAAIWAGYSAGWSQSTGIFLIGATAVEAILHRKLLPFFAIAWICYVPRFMQQSKLGEWWIHFAELRPRFLALAWIGFGGICAFAAIRQRPWELVVPQPPYPVGAIQYLSEQKFSGNLMTPFRLGAYASWKLYPEVKVSLDSRYEVSYPNAVVEQVFDFYEALPNWRTTLTAFPIDVVLVPREAPISRQIATTNWSCVYKDDQFQLYARPGLALPLQDRSSTPFRGVFP